MNKAVKSIVQAKEDVILSISWVHRLMLGGKRLFLNNHLNNTMVTFKFLLEIPFSYEILKQKEVSQMQSSKLLTDFFQLNLSAELKKQIDNLVLPVSFSKGETLLHEGEQGTCLYFILQGVVRGYYIDADGNDITKCFSAENEFCSTEGFRTKQPSSFTIECLEDCQCFVFYYTFLRQLMTESQQVNDAIRELFQEEVEKQERKNRNLVLLSAEERYRDFCQSFPELMDRVPLRCIASYIGIHFGSLSRIRSKMNLT
ncbi:MAG: Crp/Fnr family transcriptional regulator [Enterococcus sp.]|nr:Crp/Fnr family transcriptional regulator [Enterococcus sp.]